MKGKSFVRAVMLVSGFTAAMAIAENHNCDCDYWYDLYVSCIQSDLGPGEAELCDLYADNWQSCKRGACYE